MYFSSSFSLHRRLVPLLKQIFRNDRIVYRSAKTGALPKRFEFIGAPKLKHSPVALLGSYDGWKTIGKG